MSITKTFQVTGMSCSHCERAIHDEVSELAGVTGVSVSAQTGSLAVTLESEAGPDDKAIIAAVDEAGYEAVRV